MVLWFILTAVSVLFVAIDIMKTPESPVLKWGFILITAYTGPVGAFLYVLGCREPLPGLHEQYTASRWRQVLGSTMHCVAGDGLGILAGAVLGGIVLLSMPLEITLEYLLGFGFGWTIFQALFMKDSAGGSFVKALKQTFIPELVSMNYLMAAMVIVMSIGMRLMPGSGSPLSMVFWFIMSMSLLTGFIAAYPINWWLVSRHLKHGMMMGAEMSGSMMQMMHQMSEIMGNMSDMMTKDLDKSHRMEMAEMMKELSLHMEDMSTYMKSGQAPRAELAEKQKRLEKFRNKLRRYQETY